MSENKWKNRCAAFKQQWTSKYFFFSHDNPKDFIHLQFGPPGLYIAWITLWSLFHLTVLGLQPYFYIDRLPNWRWFVMFTNWSYTALTVYTLIDCLSAIYTRVKRTDIISGDAGSLPWYLKFSWALYNLNSFTSVVTFLVYYILINNDDSANGLLKHGITFVFFISHLGLSRKPFRILHCYLSLIFVFVYVIITVIYQKAFHQGAVYSMFDWDNAPKAALYSFFLIILVPVITMLCFVLTLLRDFIALKCRKVGGDSEKLDLV